MKIWKLCDVVPRSGLVIGLGMGQDDDVFGEVVVLMDAI